MSLLSRFLGRLLRHLVCREEMIHSLCGCDMVIPTRKKYIDRTINYYDKIEVNILKKKDKKWEKR